MRLVAALATYVLASVALFGREALRNPSDTVVGDAGADKTLYLWALEWWPWALRHGHNPLDVDVAWMPHGFDFGLGTAGGGLALVAAPLTTFAGPVVTYNVLILLAPALAATTAFLLADHLTRAFLPALVGGWIFGFSSYEFGRIVGHLPLAFVALVPLVPYLALRRHRDELSRRGFVILLALVMVAQFLIVTQTFFTLILVGGCAALAALVVLGGSVRATIVESAVACLLALVLIAPVIAYAIISNAAVPARSPFAESADVLNYVVPTRRTWIDVPGSDEIASRFTATGAEQGAYLSVPLLALAILAVLRRPIERPRIVLGILLVCVVALSLGTRPKVAGVVVGFGPWAPFAHLPFPRVGTPGAAHVVRRAAGRPARFARVGTSAGTPGLGAGRSRHRVDTAELAAASVVGRRAEADLLRRRLGRASRARRRDGAPSSLRSGRLVDVVASRGGVPLSAGRRPLCSSRDPSGGALA